MVKIFAAVLITCVVMIVVFQIVDPSVENVGGNAPTQLVDDSGNGTLSVSISGEITRSGTYVLEPNTTLGDLIEDDNTKQELIQMMNKNMEESASENISGKNFQENAMGKHLFGSYLYTSTVVSCDSP